MNGTNTNNNYDNSNNRNEYDNSHNRNEGSINYDRLRYNSYKSHRNR